MEKDELIQLLSNELAEKELIIQQRLEALETMYRESTKDFLPRCCSRIFSYLRIYERDQRIQWN